MKGVLLTFHETADMTHPGWKTTFGHAGDSSEQAASSGSTSSAQALEQPRRYDARSLSRRELFESKHVLEAYILKLQPGDNCLATVARIAEESSTGSDVRVCTTEDFPTSANAHVYYIDSNNENMRFAYPAMLFGMYITDGRALLCSFLSLIKGNNQGLDDENGTIYDFHFPPAHMRKYGSTRRHSHSHKVDRWYLVAAPERWLCPSARAADVTARGDGGRRAHQDAQAELRGSEPCRRLARPSQNRGEESTPQTQTAGESSDLARRRHRRSQKEREVNNDDGG